MQFQATNPRLVDAHLSGASQLAIGSAATVLQSSGLSRLSVSWAAKGSESGCGHDGHFTGLRDTGGGGWILVSRAGRGRGV